MTSEIRTLSAAQYFAADGISRSMLETLISDDKGGTPLHFYWQHIAKKEADEETPAMRLGSLTHRCILEPDTMDGAFYVKPEDMSFATKEGKAWRVEHGDRPIVSESDAKAILAMRDAVWNEPEARQFLKGAQTERCLFANDAAGTLRKARLDLIPARGNALADLKTCACPSDFHMAKAMDRLGYNRQAAFTLELCRLLSMDYAHWHLICVENTPPYDVVVWPVEAAAIAVGRREIEGAMQLYRHCLETNHWPGRKATLPELRERSLSLPAYRAREMEAA